MQITVAVALWITLIVSAIFDAASNQSTSGGNTTLGNDEGRIEDVLDNRNFSAGEIGITNDLGIGVPLVSPSFFTRMWEFLSWDRSYIKDWMEPFRWAMSALTFFFTLWALVTAAPVLIQLIEVLGTIVTGAVGGVSQIARLFFRGV